MFILRRWFFPVAAVVSLLLFLVRGSAALEGASVDNTLDFFEPECSRGSCQSSNALVFQKPLQLIRTIGTPQTGETLEVVEESMQMLRDLGVALDVVSVVGPFHSGKSFLLNRLMGLEGDGFNLGYTVDPSTKGVWMHAGQVASNAAVVFLDTEGFAASDTSADYDAKIFAIAALASSHLLYNSVRIIDKSAIDYLELLARRARLFQTKAAFSKEAPSAGLNPAHLLAMPPLTWVIQNFFQAFPEGETAAEWLQRILEAQPRDGPDRSRLTDIFPSTACFPLFMPATAPDALRELDRVDPADLTQEYLDDLQSLRTHVVNSLNATAAQVVPLRERAEKAVGGPKWWSGAHLAAVLEVLVHAANNDLMDSIPSLWTLFLEKQVQEARDSARLLFEKDLSAKMQVHPPLTEAAAAAERAEAEAAARRVFHEVLFDQKAAGPGLTAQAQAELDQAMHLAAARLDAENSKRILDHCTAVGQEAEDEAAAWLKEQALPQAEEGLKAALGAGVAERAAALRRRLREYGSHAERAASHVQERLTMHAAQVVALNKDRIAAVLDLAVREASAHYSQETARLLEGGALPREALEKQVALARGAAMRTFEATAALLAGDGSYRAYVALASQQLDGLAKKQHEENKVLAGALCREAAGAAQRHLEELHRQQAHELPEHEKTLRQTLEKDEKLVLQEFGDKVRAHEGGVAGCTAARQDLQAAAREAARELHAQNVRLWYNVVREPLRVARQRVADSAPAYWFRLTLRTHARKLAASEIGDRLPAKLKSEVIHRWLATSPEGDQQGVADLLAAKWESWGALLAALAGPLIGFLMFKLAKAPAPAPPAPAPAPRPVKNTARPAPTPAPAPQPSFQGFRPSPLSRTPPPPGPDPVEASPKTPFWNFSFTGSPARGVPLFSPDTGGAAAARVPAPCSPSWRVMKDGDQYQVRVEWRMENVEEVVRGFAGSLPPVKNFVVSWTANNAAAGAGAELLRLPFKPPLGGASPGQGRGTGSPASPARPHWCLIKPLGRPDLRGARVRIQAEDRGGRTSEAVAVEVRESAMAVIPAAMQARLPLKPPRAYLL